MKAGWTRFLHIRKNDGKLTVLREHNEPCCIFCNDECDIVHVEIRPIKPIVDGGFYQEETKTGINPLKDKEK